MKSRNIVIFNTAETEVDIITDWRYEKELIVN